MSEICEWQLIADFRLQQLVAGGLRVDPAGIHELAAECAHHGCEHAVLVRGQFAAADLPLLFAPG